MSVPTHNLYDFVHLVLEKKFILWYFFPYGSKNLTDVINLFCSDNEEQIKLLYQEYKDTCYAEIKLGKKITSWVNWEPFQPVLFCHDQEPLNFNLYQDNNLIQLDKDTHVDPKFTNKKLNLRQINPRSLQKYWILLHSEMNSNEVTLYEKTNMFVGAYWWSHAIISRDWYRFAEYDKRLKHQYVKNLFLVYCRDISGSRRYRKQFFNLLEQNCLNNFCNFGNSEVTSEHSAVYDWQDISTSGIHIVLETIFDCRIHLTEKTLRPIACGHPFIIANGPGTLNYLKKYGFKTFSPFINENYDLEQDSCVRMSMIINEMTRLSSLPEKELSTVLLECQKISEHNKKLFFSQDFFEQIVSELIDNVNKASQSITLDWKLLWKNHNRKKLTGVDKNWKERRYYMLKLITHLKKGGTVENYVPPDLD